MALGKRWVCSYSTVLTLTVVLYCTVHVLDARYYPAGHPRHGDPGPILQLLLSHGRVERRLRGLWGVELGRGVATGGGSITRGADVMGTHGLQTAQRGTCAHSPVVQAPDGHHGRARDGPAPLAPLAVRGAHASAARALQAEGGSGAPEAGGEQAEAPLGGEVVRMAQEHYFPWRPGGERDGGGAVRRSLTYDCSFPAVCFATV